VALLMTVAPLLMMAVHGQVGLPGSTPRKAPALAGCQCFAGVQLCLRGKGTCRPGISQSMLSGHDCSATVPAAPACTALACQEDEWPPASPHLCVSSPPFRRSRRGWPGWR
jgi:hypothetical protein